MLLKVNTMNEEDCERARAALEEEEEQEAVNFVIEFINERKRRALDRTCQLQAQRLSGAVLQTFGPMQTFGPLHRHPH